MGKPVAAVRVNARLTGEDARRLRDVQKQEKRSTSDILRAALREYADRRLPRRTAYEILRDGGFIGCIKGLPPGDYSSKHAIRAAMTEALEREAAPDLKVAEPPAPVVTKPARQRRKQA